MSTTTTLPSGKTLTVSVAADGIGLTLIIGTPLGTFREYLKTETAGAIMFSFDQVLTELDVLRERLAEAAAG